MPNSYAVFLRRSVADSLSTMLGPRKSAILKFIDYLGDNPFDEGDFSEKDTSDRYVYCKIIRDYAITYYVDHALKEVKVLELTRTP